MPKIPVRQFNSPVQMYRQQRRSVEEFLPLISRYSISRGGSTGEETEPLDEFLNRLAEKEEKRRKRKELLAMYIRAGVSPEQIPVEIRTGITSEMRSLYEKAGVDLENHLVRSLMELE